MNDEIFPDDSEQNDDDGDEIDQLEDTEPYWRKSDGLDARRKLERLFELRQLKELDEAIAWEDLE